MIVFTRLRDVNAIEGDVKLLNRERRKLWVTFVASVKSTSFPEAEVNLPRT